MMNYIVERNGVKTILITNGALPELPEGFTLIGPENENLLIKEEMEISKNKQDRIALAYNSMLNDSLAQMAITFGTTKTDSATAYNATWDLMKAQPSEFINDDMPTEQDVLDFVNPKLASVLSYAKYRLARIKQFKAEKLLIENE